MLSHRDRFNVPPDVAYFNTAYMSPQLRSVRLAGEQALDRRGRPWEITVDDWFRDIERLRELFAGIVGGEPDGVAIIPATSYGFAVAAENVRIGAGRRILVLGQEYPSGVYTWRRAARRAGAEVVTASRRPGQTWAEAVLDVLDDRVDVVSVPHVHWTDGSLVDLPVVAQRTHELGASLVIDASQSVGAMPVDVHQLRPDFLITVGYKWLLGPVSLGYLYVADRHRDGRPVEENWIGREGAEDFTRLVEYRDEYMPGARRFDVGQRTKFELAPMAVAALEAVTEWTVAGIADALTERTASIARRAEELGAVLPPDDQRGPHLLGISLPDEAAADVVAGLAAARCYAALRGRTLRIAPHLHNSDDDVDTLIGALATTLNGVGA